MYERGPSQRSRYGVFALVCVAILLASVIIIPENIVSGLAAIVPEPSIFVPNGEAAELLIDGNDSVYWLHIVGGDVYFRRYNSSHMPEITGKPIYLSGTNENVDAVWDDFGYIHFTWATDYFGAQSVMYAKIDTNGDFVVPPIKLSGNNIARDFSSAIDTNSLGQAYVAWDYWWDPSHYLNEDVLYAKIDSDGSIIFTQEYVAPVSWDTDFFGKKDLVVDRADNLHVIFDRIVSSPQIQVYYKKFGSDGLTVLVNEKQLIPVSYATWSSAMEAVLDSHDKINIGFSYGYSGRVETFYARIDLQGNLEIGPIELSSVDNYHSRRSYLALDNYENSYVFWMEHKDGNEEVYYAALDSNGSVARPATRVTSTTDDESSYYMGAVFDSGNTCIWSRYNSSGTYVVYPGPWPETTIVPGLPRFGFLPTFVTSATDFSFIVKDNSGSGIRGTYYHIDTGLWVNYTQSGPFTVSAEGMHSIFYNSTDNMGNHEPTKTFDIAVDNTPPTSSVTVGEPNYTSTNNWISSSTPISIVSVDGGLTPVGVDQTEYRVWNGGSWTMWENYVAPFTIGPSEGTSYVEVYSADLLGNVESIRNVTYIVDNTPPLTRLHVGAPNHTSVYTWVTSSTTIILDSMDAGFYPVGVSQVLYRTWQGGSWDNWTEYSSPFTLSLEGTSFIEYLSVDFLNNSEPVSNSSLIVDDSPPTTSHHVGEPNYTALNTWVNSSTPISLTVGDGGPVPVGVNHTYYRIWAGGWGSWQEYTSSFNLGSEGLNYVEFNSTDLIGNHEASQNATLIVDNTPPSITFTVGYPRYRPSPSSWWNVTSSTPLLLSAQDKGSSPVGISAMECRVLPSSIWAECSSPFNLTGYGEGPQRIEFRSMDLLGNMNDDFIDLMVDDSPPYSTLIPGSPQYIGSDIWVTSNTEFEIVSPDEGSPPVGTNYSMYRVWNGDSWSPWISYSSPFSLGTSEGRSYVEYYAVDLVSNEEVIVNETFIVDNSAPVTLVQVGEPRYTAANTWISSATSISLTANDWGDIPVGMDDTHYRIWAGSWGSWREYSSPFTLVTEGVNYVEHNSVDLLGNSETTQNSTFIVDNTPPTSLIQMGAPNYSFIDIWITSSTPVTLAVTDGGEMPVGTDHSFYRIWAGSWGSWREYSSQFNLDTEGLNYVEHYSEDLLGNREIDMNVTFIVDNSPPMTTVDIGGPRFRGESNARWNVTSSSLFFLNSTDGGPIPCGVEVIEVFIDGIFAGNYTEAFTLEGYQDGIRNIDFRGIDNLGNKENHNLISVNLDNTPPNTEIHPTKDIALNEMFSLQADDGHGSGVKEILFAIDDGEWQNYTGEFRWEEYGNHTITYKSVDNLGNMEDPREFIFNIPRPIKNWKPLIALILTIILLVVGLIVSKRRPIEFKVGRSATKTFMLVSLPFVLAEAITGIVSLITGSFAIPPLLGIGTVVDLGILLAGLIVLAIHGVSMGEPEASTEESPQPED